MIREFLDGQPNQANRANWTVVCEPTKYSSARYWMVTFPRWGNWHYAKFIWETDRDEIAFDVDGDKPVPLHDLQFWYDAQRQPGDW